MPKENKEKRRRTLVKSNHRYSTYVLFGMIFLFGVVGAAASLNLAEVLENGNDAQGQAILNTSDVNSSAFTLNGSTIYNWSQVASFIVSNETDTLQSVTDRGATTDNTITISPSGNNDALIANGGGSGDGIDITHSGSGTSLNIDHSGSGDEIVVNTDEFVVSNGKVGIGTSNPIYDLDVDGSFTAYAILINNSNSLISMNPINGVFIMQSTLGDVTSNDRLVVLGDDNKASGNLAQSVIAGSRNEFYDTFSSSSRNVILGDGNKGYNFFPESIISGFANQVNNSARAFVSGSSNYNGMFGNNGNYITGNRNILGSSFTFSDNNFIYGSNGKITSGNFRSLFSLNQDNNNKIENNDDYSFLFATKKTSGSVQNLAQFEHDAGARFGATSGESINMTGDDLYVADNTEIDGFLVLGSNTEDGLSAGDINASTIYYDALVAKSPITLCSEEDYKCFVIDVEAEKEYYVDIDENYNILSSKNKNAKKEEQVTQKIQDKFEKLKEKKIKDDAKKQKKQNCEKTGYSLIDNVCYDITRKKVTYAQAIESIKKPIYETIEVTKTQLNRNLQEETYTVKERTDTILGYEEEFRFKDNCAWEEQTGYYCDVREEVLI